MPQMSPLMWSILIVFFISSYFILSIVIYYQSCLVSFTQREIAPSHMILFKFN